MSDRRCPVEAAAGAALSAAREAHEQRSWELAYARFTDADAVRPLGPADLDRAWVAGRMVDARPACDEFAERAHHAWLAADEPGRAARSAFWLGLALAHDAEEVRGGAWFARATATLDDHDLRTVERGLLLVPPIIGRLAAGSYDDALQLVEQAREFQGDVQDPDLLAVTQLGRGQALVGLGRVEAGVRSLDDAMLTVTSGRTLPLLAGIVYCAVIDTCFDVCDLARAEEWTGALQTWCTRQPGLVPFRGQCLVDRAELARLHGDWEDASARVLEAHERFEQSRHPAIGESWYLRGELARACGDLDEAEDAYRQADAHGRDPNPGLALLRLARGDVGSALSASQRCLDDPRRRRARAHALAAHVQICLAADELDGARAAAAELHALREQLETPLLGAMAEHAAGAVALAAGDTAGAMAALRRALTAWTSVDAPLEAARTRVLIGTACIADGDTEGADWAWDLARRTFADLGAAPDLAALDHLVATHTDPPPRTTGGLTGRELEVLEQLATGRTNREIAEVLVISEKTVARHVANIFTKVGVSTRAAATAYAFRHDLV